MTTFLGIILGLGLMAYAIFEVSQSKPGASTSTLSLYLSLAAFFLVGGGTLASTLIAHPFSHLMRGLRAFGLVFTRRSVSFVKAVEEICEFSEVHIQKGITGLEEKLKQYKSRDLVTDGIAMIVNGYTLEEVASFLETSLQRRYDREMIDVYVFKTMARAAPAFGMVGTLVGLIYMLRVMGDAPDKVGPFLALALVATFYGLVLAHLVFYPMGNKILHHAELNLRIGRMQIEGVSYIHKKLHPIYIKDQLSAYVPPTDRGALFKEEKGK